MIRVKLIQKEEELTMTGPLSVKALLDEIGAKVTTTVVMRKEKILTPEKTVSNGDTIEIISVVSGG
jgi:sulfur carrier protein ThiS